MSDSEEFKLSTPPNEEGIGEERQSLGFPKESSTVESLESMISYRIDKKRIRRLDTGTPKRGASAEVELAILLPQDLSEPLSTEESQHVAVKKLKMGDNSNEERVLRIRIIPSRSNSGDGIQSQSAALLKSIGQMHIDQGRVQQGITDIRRSLDIFRSTGDNEGVASTLCALAIAYFRIEEDSKAEETFTEAQEISSRFGYIWELGRALSGLAKIYYYQGDTGKAISSLIQVMELYTRLGTEVAIANVNYELGLVYMGEANYDEAESTLSKAYTLYTSIGADLGIGNAAAALGQLFFRREDVMKSASLLLEAQNIYERIGEKNGLTNTLWHRAKIYEREKQYTKALALLEEAQNISHDLGLTEYIARCDDFSQIIHEKMKDAAERVVN
ncbi:hypothetical protein M407DRAFT_6845 [Tulasnella calospora MUT 4182]|uniref:Tetratricopeptide repeat protein 29 n=1 Tax=Tulasnella calospora MUT 4182 TaxID=1051891 RepID=A0A0C3QL78_9AGAM|nr:hypothetical protein M407DRAFT_6845 [Tulasnella calospora MUT 4182]